MSGRASIPAGNNIAAAAEPKFLNGIVPLQADLGKSKHLEKLGYSACFANVVTI
jgi:hypothetical protein